MLKLIVTYHYSTAFIIISVECPHNERIINMFVWFNNKRLEENTSTRAGRYNDDDIILIVGRVISKTSETCCDISV